MRHLVTRVAVSIVLAQAAVGCSSGGDDGGGGGAADAAAGNPDSGLDQPDADVRAFIELISADWTIEPGTEPYRCARLTVTEDTYIAALKDLSPLGTHHTVLSVGEPSDPDGEFACSAGANKMQMLFASGVGSDAFSFPDGVAYKVSAGQQLQLNLHLYNAGAVPLVGHSATLVELVPAADVADVELAEVVFAGDFSLSIAPTGEPEYEQGSCTMDAGTLLNIWPHMHQLGTHMEVTLDGETIHDEDFRFTEQKNWPKDLPLTDGQVLSVTCTYVNDGDVEVYFGDSSEAEMCFAGFYRYPATGAGMYCGF